MQSSRGARSATGRTSHGLGWVPWVAVLALLLIVAAATLIALNVNDNNDSPGLDVNNDSAPAHQIITPAADLATDHQQILITTGATQ